MNYEFLFTKDLNAHFAEFSDTVRNMCMDDTKNTYEDCFFIYKNLILRYNKKQNTNFMLMIEAEYIDVNSYYVKLVWLKQMIENYGIIQDILVFFCNGTSGINISKNYDHHIDLKDNYIRELVENKLLTIEHVETMKQLADNINKALNLLYSNS